MSDQSELPQVIVIRQAGLWHVEVAEQASRAEVLGSRGQPRRWTRASAAFYFALRRYPGSPSYQLALG